MENFIIVLFRGNGTIEVFVVYIDTGSLVLYIPSKSCDLADENNKICTEWKWFETTVSNQLFYLYQRLEYRDNYFFKIKFVFFLNLLLSASLKENDLPLYISDIRQILGTEHQYLFSRFHITITYNLLHLQLWNAVFVVYIDTGSLVLYIPSKSRDLANENNKILTEWKWFETTVSNHRWLKLLNMTNTFQRTNID
jgi:hypothetical protein